MVVNWIAHTELWRIKDFIVNTLSSKVADVRHPWYMVGKNL